MDDRMLDGNAIGGLLEEIFAVEMTTAVGTCNGCGTAGPVGEAHVFNGAGVVLRCPHCDAVLATIVRADRRTWISLAGIRGLELVVAR